MLLTLRIYHLHRLQVIKEKLVFPSGTATAQLISVLHRTPLQNHPGSDDPTNGFLRKRIRRQYSEYEALDTEDLSGQYQQGSEDEDAHQHTDGLDVTMQDEDDRREKLLQVGWTVLGWSFSASAFLTVSIIVHFNSSKNTS